MKVRRNDFVAAYTASLRQLRVVGGGAEGEQGCDTDDRSAFAPNHPGKGGADQADRCQNVQLHQLFGGPSVPLSSTIVAMGWGPKPTHGQRWREAQLWRAAFGSARDFEKQAQNVGGAADDDPGRCHLEAGGPPGAQGEQRLGGADQEMRDERDYRGHENRCCAT